MASWSVSRLAAASFLKSGANFLQFGAAIVASRRTQLFDIKKNKQTETTNNYCSTTPEIVPKKHHRHSLFVLTLLLLPRAKKQTKDIFESIHNVCPLSAGPNQ